MDDPFGDPFAEQPAPVVKKPPAKPVVKPTPPSSTASSSASASSTASKPAPPSEPSPPAPVKATSTPSTKPQPPPSPPSQPIQPKAAGSEHKRETRGPDPPPPVQLPKSTPKPSTTSSSNGGGLTDPFAEETEDLPKPVVKKTTPAPTPTPAVTKPKEVAKSNGASNGLTDPFADDSDLFADPAPKAKPVTKTKITAVKPKSPVVPAPDPVEEKVIIETPKPSPPEPAPAPPKPKVVEKPVVAEDDFVVPVPVEKPSSPAPVADESTVAETTSTNSTSSTPAPDATSASSPPPTTSTADAAIASLAASYVDLDDEFAEDELSLEDQGLTAFPEELIKTRGAALRRIDFTSNKLTHLKSLQWTFGPPAWPALTELILDKNQLESIAGIGQIPTLTTLWINNNKIHDLDALLDSIEKFFPRLTYLSVLRNPCTPDIYFSTSDGELESYGRWRLYVIYRLKNLQFLDSTEVTTEERKEATLRGAYCRVAKPQPVQTKKTKADDSSASSSSPIAAATSPIRQSQVGLDKNGKPPKVATFLAKGKPRYDGTNSEGNRFIMNDDL